MQTCIDACGTTGFTLIGEQGIFGANAAAAGD
jgi:hypothetical protein